jgi:hypothetical protein
MSERRDPRPTDPLDAIAAETTRRTGRIPSQASSAIGSPSRAAFLNALPLRFLWIVERHFCGLGLADV